MKTLVSMMLTLLAMASASANAQDLTLTLATVPPVVVKTVPQAGSEDVDPALKEVHVTFSKDMMDKSWSFATASKDSFPKAAGDAKYEGDKRTCVLPVTLEPGKTYAIWVNTQKLQNFKDADKRPAVPYLLVFKTKG